MMRLQEYDALYIIYYGNTNKQTVTVYYVADYSVIRSSYS